MRFSVIVNIVNTAFILYTSGAMALEASFQDWSIFKENRGDKTLCYMLSTPIEKSSTYKKRGESYFLVTNIDDEADEITASSGFLYKHSSDIEISFGLKKFYLFPNQAIAWANNKNDDIEIIKELQRSDEVIVSATAKNNKTASDRYSLIGFVEGYKKMKEICKN
jgi:hypothetical protein